MEKFGQSILVQALAPIGERDEYVEHYKRTQIAVAAMVRSWLIPAKVLAADLESGDGKTKDHPA
jgi:hypothetical protein